ncbi:RICIN domain-containing protein [Streptomyces cadmiisoli]|uniref:RICIN domain-containing protein n=1 Tax=Streptomyces cadmiisoli TaxID=2184053 RepID=UPI003D709605
MNGTAHQDALSVHHAAALMPDITALEDRARALAVISAIADSGSEGEQGYRYAPSGCPHGSGAVLHGYSEARWLQVHFHGDAGAVVFLWDIDADFAPELTYEVEEPWEAVLLQVPEALRPCLYGGDGDSFVTDSGVLLPQYISAVMWRRPEDPAWQTADIPELENPADDSALFVLTDVIAPSPGTVMLSTGLGVERASSALVDAVRHILALRPLTEGIVRTLNPDRSLADVAEVVDAIGYRPVEPALPLDQGVGEGAPLVTQPSARQPFSLGHFLLKPDGDGYHRILVHHSGKALEVTGTAAGGGVVQSEPHDRDSQRFLVQHHIEGEFRDVPGVPGFDPAYDSVQSGSSAIPHPVYRIIAKESGLALQAGAHPGAPVVLAEAHDGDDQLFRRSRLFGYGSWMCLARRDTGESIVVDQQNA